MAAGIIDQDTALETVLQHHAFSLTHLSAHPLTADLVPGFLAFQEKWMQINTQEILLSIDIFKASALIIASDDALDILVDAVSNALLTLTKNDRGSLLYRLYFGDKTASEQKKPTLAGQLESMRNWIGPLKSSPHASLTALAPDLEKKVAAADAAKAALATAQTANRVFRTTGARKALIDEFNALRKLTYGKLAELPHKHPGHNLPGSFADQFFKRVSRPKEAIEPPTSADILTQIAELETTLSALREKLKEVLKQEEAEAQAERDREAEDAELAALEKQRKELDAKIAEKKAKHPKS